MSEAFEGILRLAQNGRTRAARQALQEELRNQPDDPDLLFARGYVAYREDEYTEARQAFEEVLARDPEYIPALHLLASVAMETKSYSEAEQLLLHIIERHPEDADAFASYARVMMETLHTDKARALAEESLRLDPTHHEAEFVMLLLDMMDGDQKDVHARVSEMIADRPDDLRTIASLYLVLIDSGRHREALGVGQELLRHSPDKEDIVEGLVDLRVASHWSTWPLRPLARWGWTASAIIWGLSVVMFRLLEQYAPDIAGPAAIVFLAFVAYSWVWPPILRRWFQRRGI